jgi:L-lactate dehydrogenase complex protein LldF
MTTFRREIRVKIADETLQKALDNNAARRVKGRTEAFASLPDWRERRQRAQSVRADVIEHLDGYLDQFITRVTENGIRVHRAGDAHQANRIALEIINNSPPIAHGGKGQAPRLIAKSKSMVTEEIHLNHALEKAGHRVVETDLGEYIVQLRGERPSHIITPASHLRRDQVGELFHDKLGISYTEDIPTLTGTARKKLREIFLGADMGVSGVNFGVAQTGTLAIVTNEGNGRMVTTLPPIHITFMGMERLVPTLDDLALMLSLLPRSATGQKISVYTQLIQRPLAGQGRHLILVDNGRTRLHDSHLKEILYCIRCGACLNACPVFREIGGHGYIGTNGSIAPYPGPVGAVVSPGLLGQDYFQLAQASSLCGACKDACPVDIDLPKLLTRVRAGEMENQGYALPAPVKFGLRIYTRISTRPGLYALSQRLVGLGARLLAPLSAWIKFPAFTGWGARKDFPRPAARPFRDKWSEIAPVDSQVTEKKEKKEAVIGTPHAKNFDLVPRFIEELTVLGGHVIQTTEHELSNQLIYLLREKNIDRVQAWESVPGLDAAVLRNRGISVQAEAEESLKAGITGALAGIAETGTLVIQSGEGRPLTASLLPEIHIALLRANDVQESFEQVMGLHRIEEYASVVLVSGPSRTADIEMTLTIGVHGPGELYVFILE